MALTDADREFEYGRKMKPGGSLDFTQPKAAPVPPAAPAAPAAVTPYSAGKAAGQAVRKATGGVRGIGGAGVIAAVPSTVLAAAGAPQEAVDSPLEFLGRGVGEWAAKKSLPADYVRAAEEQGVSAFEGFGGREAVSRNNTTPIMRRKLAAATETDAWRAGEPGKPETRFQIPEFTGQEMRNPARDRAINTRVGEGRNTFEDLTPAQIARNNEIAGRLGSQGGGGEWAPPEGAASGDVYGWRKSRTGRLYYDDTPIQPQQEAAPDIGSMTIPQMAAYAIQSRKANAAKRAAAEEAKFGRELSSRERMAQMQEAGQESRFGRAQAGEESRMMARLKAEQSARLEDKYSPEGEARNAELRAKGRLYDVQAGTAEARLEDEMLIHNAKRKLADPKATPDDIARAEAILARDMNERIRFEQEKEKAKAKARAEAEGYAAGGAIEGYAIGGRIPRGFTDGSQVGSMQPAQNLDPILAEYGQYLQNAARVGVAPVPLQQYMAGKQQVSQFADGGMIERYQEGGEIGQRQTYFQNDPMAAVKKAGSRAYDSTIGAAADKISDWFAPAPRNTPTPITPRPAHYAMTLTPEQEAEAMGRPGYADGGAVSVSGRKVLGPGTGTSDSIPAVIDGHRPAALSSGEFVIPAHIVRAKGTEFFDKLLASYADKGAGNGE